MKPIVIKPIVIKQCFGFLLITAAVVLWAQRPAPPPVDEKLPLPPIEQPLPFSHKAHGASGLSCKDCHKIAEPGYQAGFPSEATCMACHVSIKKESPAIQKLASLAKAKQKIVWKKIYNIPEYVWFSHASHAVDAKIACETCHGPVSEREVLFKEKPTNMTSCMRCHAQHGAPNGCDFCHNTQ